MPVIWLLLEAIAYVEGADPVSVSRLPLASYDQPRVMALLTALVIRSNVLYP
jgi:hypothetical protein